MSTGLRINGDKCQFTMSEVDFLGYIINSEGIKPPSSRTKALQELPPPTDAKMLTRYLGMFGFYQRCIPRFAEVTSLLRDILRTPEFEWTDQDTVSYTHLTLPTTPYV